MQAATLLTSHADRELEKTELLPRGIDTSLGDTWAQPYDKRDVPEDDKDWSEYLRGYKKQYLLIACLYAGPCYAIFMYSVVMSIWYGSWWNTSAGQPYIAKEEDLKMGKYIDVYRSLPAVLETHMWFAVLMLGLITFQIGFAIVGTFCGLKNAFKYHRALGIFTAMAIFVAAFLGTVSLFLCDVQPKRGSENLFFCAIGVGIMVFLVMGLYYAGKGLYGLHFQYMCISVCLVFSPGWNRITTVIIRHALQSIRGVTQGCFVMSTWSEHGYFYVWSFYAGMGSLALWWLLVPCTRAPFFKKYSVGWFYMLGMFGILLGCTWQTFIDWEQAPAWPLSSIQNCTKQEFTSWSNFTKGAKTAGLYSINMGYGVCAPSSASKQQGVPQIFVQHPVIEQPRTAPQNVGMRTDDLSLSEKYEKTAIAYWQGEM